MPRSRDGGDALPPRTLPEPLALETPWIWRPHQLPGETLTVAIFLRLVGIVFVLAFVSAGVQIAGLSGPDGILPARDYLAAVADHYGLARYWLVPSLAWLGSGTTALHALCVAGGLCGALLAFGVAPLSSTLGS